MKKLSAPIAGIIACFAFISCQKENSSETIANPASIVGTYKFISLQTTGSTTVSTSVGTYVEKAVTVTNYLSENNSGTITFTPTAMSSTNLSYEIDTDLKVYLYINNHLEDSLDVPFMFQVPPTSSTSSYKLVTSDSIYFSGGSMFRDGTPAQQTQGSGARIKREGDKLMIIIHDKKTTTQNTQGMLVTNSLDGVGTITLQKL